MSIREIVDKAMDEMGIDGCNDYGRSTIRDVACHAIRLAMGGDRQGYCTERDRCECGGDTPEVRATCPNWITD